MLIIQCNCMNCRKLSGSYQLGCLYAVTEITQSGETDIYQFEGGSGYLNTAHFCKKCHVRCKTHPAPEVMEGMVLTVSDLWHIMLEDAIMEAAKQ